MYLGDGDNDRREILHHGTSRSPFGGRTPKDPQNPKFWTFNREYLKNGKSQRNMSIRA